MEIPENSKLGIENFGKLNDLEVLDTLCEDVHPVRRCCWGEEGGEFSLAIDRKYCRLQTSFPNGGALDPRARQCLGLGRITYLLSTVEDSWYDVSSTILG